MRANWIWKCEKKKNQKFAEIFTWEDGDNLNPTLKTGRKVGFGGEGGSQKVLLLHGELETFCYNHMKTVGDSFNTDLELKGAVGAKEKDLDALQTPTIKGWLRGRNKQKEKQW